MSRLRAPAILVLVVALGGWLAWDAPLFVHHSPPAPLTPDATLYLDRAYRLVSVPEQLAGARVVPVHRHTERPVRLRIEEDATLVLFHAARPPPPAWEEWERAPFDVRLPGAQAQLTTAWTRHFEAGRHTIDPAGFGAASPVVVLGGGDVRELQSLASLARRAEVATRGVSRLRPALLVAAGALLLAVAIFLAGRASRRLSG